MGRAERMVHYAEGEIRLRLPDKRSLALKPQDCWRLVEDARSVLIDDSPRFEPRVLREVSRGGRRFQVALSKNNGFWDNFRAGSWEPHTFAVFDRFLNEGSIYLDVGAWIGPTLFYAAQVAKAAFAFEPDPVAFDELAINLRANQGEAWASKVSILNKAIASASGQILLGSRGGGGDSESSFLFAGEQTTWQVESVALREFLREQQIAGGVFIKIDIEGGEYDLVPGLRPLLRSHDMDVYLSLHPSFLKSYLRKRCQPGRSRVRRRLLFFSKHCRLLRGLPFRHLYGRSGALLKPLALKYEALANGRFPTELVATNKTWSRA